MGGRDEAHASDPALQGPFNPPDDLVQSELMLDDGSVVAADLIVLAIKALHVAAREEYVADAVRAANGGLLALVDADGAHAEAGRRAAIAEGPIQASCVAVAGAARAVRQVRKRLGDLGPVRHRSRCLHGVLPCQSSLETRTRQ